VADLNWREVAVLAPLILFIVWIGVFPRPFLSKMETSVGHFIKLVHTEPAARAALLEPRTMAGQAPDVSIVSRTR
jgi:NADH:ubiquinone oxidoreductase subunit 4 (subunit M)